MRRANISARILLSSKFFEPTVTRALSAGIACTASDSKVETIAAEVRRLLVGQATEQTLCDGGTVIQVERGEFLPLGEDLAWEITGETGSLRLRMAQGRPGPTVTLDQADEQSGWFTTEVFAEPDDENTTDLVIADFAGALAEGRPPQTTLDQAMVIQQIIDAMYESSRTGGPVEVAKLALRNEIHK